MVAPRFSFLNKLSLRLVATLLLVVLFALLSMGLTAFLTERSTLYSKTFDSLEVVLVAKTSDIQRWIGERIADIDLLALNRLNQSYFTEISQPDLDPERRDRLRLALRENLLSLKRARPFYTRIDIANADGTIKVSTSQTSTHINQETFLNTIRHPDTAYIRDMYNDPEHDEIFMQFSRALYAVDSTSGAETDTIMGVVVLTIDIEDSLFPLLEDYQFLGETGEVILGRTGETETTFLNNVRHSEKPTALVHRISHDSQPQQPIVLASQGNRGTVVAMDRRQNQTFLAYNSLPETGWGLVVKTDSREALEPLWSLVKWLSILALLPLACALYFALRLWRRIAQPVSYLTTAIDSVTNGDLAVDIQIMNDDEMGALAESLREMFESLRRRRIDLHYATKAVEMTEQENTQLVMQLRELNTDLEHIVHDRTAELSVANSKLKQLDELKSKFISNVSHELRNPVASLKLYVNLLNKSTDQNRERYLNAIGRQIDILSHLVENVLDISHLETDGLRIMLSPCDIKLIVQRVVESNRPRAEDAGLDLTLELCKEPAIVLASASKLMQLITNLVTNALNYTEQGVVSVKISTVGEDAVIIVEDTGIGIPKEDMPHLFERFYRGHNVNELEIRGTGLGLGIVKEVVDLHAGKIMVESEEGRGTRFQISIPLAKNSYASSSEQILSKREAIA